MQYAPEKADFRYKLNGEYVRPTGVRGGFRKKAAKPERRERICKGCSFEVSRAGICVNC